MDIRRYLSDCEKSRANNFDALRLALALLVIFSHSYPLLLGNGNNSEPVFRATGGQQTAGDLAISGFFLISGYLITASWQRSGGLVDYLRRRVLRIYPGFLVAVLFSSLIAGPLLVADSAGFWEHFQVDQFLLSALGLVRAWTPFVQTNGSLWSIRYEFCCYLAVAVFGLLGILRRRPVVVLFVVLCTGLEIGIRLFGMQMPGSRLSWIWGWPQIWPFLASCFFAGASFHLYADRIIHSGRLAVVALVVLLLAAFIPGSKALPIVIPYSGGYLIFYLAFLPAGRIKDIARRGDLSYGLYLYAYPIQLLLVHWLQPRLSPISLAILAMIVTAVFATLSWRFVERPFLIMKRTAPPTGPIHEVSVAPARIGT